MTFPKRAFASLAVIAACGCSAPCLAAPEEIQVYLDDLTQPGRFGTDIHNNYVASGSSAPEYEGALAPNHVYRLTPEFYYGLSDTVELGLYVLGALRPGDGASLDGAKLRVKYIAPHYRERGSFWGANLELGKTDLAFAERPWNAELKGIYGLRSGRWTFGANADLDWSMSSGGGPVALGLDSKLAYLTRAGYQAGFELYNEFGPLSSPGNLGQRSQMLYGVIDTTTAGGLDLNVGLGRGLTSASDRWVIKFIVGLHYP